VSSSPIQTLRLNLPDEAQTQALAQRLAAVLRPALDAGPNSVAVCPSVRVHLQGELGSGKTTFARALLRALGVTGRIKSPSYALLESYKISNLYLHHLDFYRFSKDQDWEDAGFREVLQAPGALILVEWPEQAGTRLPAPDLVLSLSYDEAHGHRTDARTAQLAAHSTQGQVWLTRLKQTLRVGSGDGLAPDGGACWPPPSTPRC